MFFFTLLKTEPTVLENAIVLKRNKGAIFCKKYGQDEGSMAGDIFSFG